MSEDIFLTYQKFYHKNESIELTEQLIANKIDYLLVDSSSSFDSTFANNYFNTEFTLKLKKQDFQKADDLMLSFSNNLIDEVDESYYLFEFSDDELLDVLKKYEEWGKLDYLLAQKILKNRGVTVSDNLLSTFKKQRIEELSKPEEVLGLK
jgi:translation elongation factor EF-G